MKDHDVSIHLKTIAPGHRFIRMPAVCEMSGLSRSQIYRLQAAGQFPQGIKLAQSAIAWLEAEVAQWQADRIASRPIVVSAMQAEDVSPNRRGQSKS